VVIILYCFQPFDQYDKFTSNISDKFIDIVDIIVDPNHITKKSPNNVNVVDNIRQTNNIEQNNNIEQTNNIGSLDISKQEIDYKKRALVLVDSLLIDSKQLNTYYDETVFKAGQPELYYYIEMKRIRRQLDNINIANPVQRKYEFKRIYEKIIQTFKQLHFMINPSQETIVLYNRRIENINNVIKMV